MKPDAIEGLRRAFGRKVAFVTASYWTFGVGVVLTLLFLAGVEDILDRIPTFGLASTFSDWVADLTGLPDPVLAVRLLIAATLMGVVFIVASILGWLVGRSLAKRIGPKGGFTPYGRHVARLARHQRSAAFLHITAGLLILASAVVTLLLLGGPVPLVKTLPLFAGGGFAMIGLGLATLLPLKPLLDEPDPPPPTPEPPPPPGPKAANATAQELLDRLASSPIWRSQVVGTQDYPARPVLSDADEDGVRLLLRRYPQLEPVLRASGIQQLTLHQTGALKAVLAAEKAARSHRRSADFVFWGWPGSGRSTLASLLAFGAVLEREGAMYCVTASSEQFGVYGDGALRHPATQLRRWIQDSGVKDVGLAEAYAASDNSGALREHPNVVFTDVRMLSQLVLSDVGGAGAALLRRLRYVIIDHPNRLSREDLVRLQIALARLRMLAELHGSVPTFLVLLPPLNNNQRLVKFLLNNADVPFAAFEAWQGKCKVVAWLPPLEALEGAPTHEVVRAPLADEVQALLEELGVQSNLLPKALRIGVIDPRPLLGPEARGWLARAVEGRLAKELTIAAQSASGEDGAGEDGDGAPTPAQTPRLGAGQVRLNWVWFGSPDVVIDHRDDFDVIIAIGIGPHPDYLVGSLRSALADEGALILVGDASAEDIESLRTVREGERSPRATDVLGPSVILPEHSAPIIAHELASLFEDFGQRPVPRARLLELLPDEHTRELLDAWQAQGALESVEVFVGLDGDGRPIRAEFLRRSEDDTELTGDAWRIPWGCMTRRVLRLYDHAAHGPAVTGPYYQRVIDEDRLFVDFFPRAMFRYPPNTVVVVGRRGRELDAEELAAAAQRAVTVGDLDVDAVAHHRCIELDRRLPRYATTIAPAPVAGGGAAEEAESLARHSAPRSVEGVLDLHCGQGKLCLDEQLRDIVQTGPRLVEEPGFVTRWEPPDVASWRREHRCAAISLVLGHRGTPPAEAGSYAGHHGLARAIASFLRRAYLNFDDELRVAVVPRARAEESEDTDPFTPFRILLYRIRSDELSLLGLFRETFESTPDVRRMLRWIHARLERCDCRDGCACCCGGLGTAPQGPDVDEEVYTELDAVSRRHAYALVCGLLGQEPDWTAFEVAAPDGAEIDDAELQRAVREVLHSWPDLFAADMQIPPDEVALAKWMVPEEQIRDVAGLYRSGTNEVLVRRTESPDWLREVLVHEFCHNWQFRSGGFDMERLARSDEATRYFDGNLVIEGHAVWGETRYRYSRRLGARYSPTDDRPWNEYKVGYFLIEGIERAVGERGLLRWLSPAGTEEGGAAPVRSRNPRLSWPFTLDQALDALRLRDDALRGSFTATDVDLEPIAPGELPPDGLPVA